MTFGTPWSGTSVAMPALPPGTWSVQATASGFGLGATGTFTMTGSGIGSGASWNGNSGWDPPCIIDTGASDRYAMLYGVAGGGDAPTVEIVASDTQQLREGSTYGTLAIEATLVVAAP